MADQATHARKLLGMARSWALSALPGWSDDAHRDLLARHGATAVDGRVTAMSMDVAQLRAAVADYERRGWPRLRKQSMAVQAAPNQKQIRHLVGLWSGLGTAGKVSNSSRSALLAFCARQVDRQVSKLDDLTTTELQRLIEALKAWSKRP